MPADTPIRLSDHVYALPLEVTLGEHPTILYPALILDGARGATLVDVGVPGMQGDLEAALAALQLGWDDVKRVIVTHHDLDHVGSLPAVVAATGAEVLTSEAEVPYVQGEKPGQKSPPPDRIAAMPPEVAARFANPPRATVTRVLQDGEVLDLAGGVQVIATPGHTVGHLSLFVPGDGVLIAGDALISEGGQLQGPSERFTPDMPEARRSVQKLATLPVTTVLTYHGGPVREDAAGQLARVAAQVST